MAPGITVIGVGANVGHYTVAAAAREGSKGRIFATEPDVRAFARLKKLISENHLPVSAVN